MPRNPDGTLRANTPAELDLIDLLCAAFAADLDNPDRLDDDPLWLAGVALQAVIDARWTPPRDVRIPIDTAPRFPAGYLDTTETR